MRHSRDTVDPRKPKSQQTKPYTPLQTLITITILIVASLKELITQIMEIARRTVQVMEYTFKKVGSNKIFQNIKDFHRTTMLAIAIATNTTDRTNYSGHAQINNRSMQNSPGMRIPNDEYNESYQSPTSRTHNYSSN